MSDDALPEPTERHYLQAREQVIQRLGLISMIIWVIGVLLFMWLVFPGRPFKPSIGGMVSGLCFLVAAIPWLAYRPMVQRTARELAEK